MRRADRADRCGCGKTYAATDLIDPHSALTGSQPVLKPTEHLFFRLSEFSDELQQWLHSGSGDCILEPSGCTTPV